MRKRLHIKVSRLCNNNCIFCLDDRARRTDIGEREVKAHLEEGKALGGMLFTCGEPTLHPKLPLFIGMARAAGYRSIGLVTNGRRLSYPDYCDRLLELGLTEVTLSIHGHAAAMHDALTRTRGSFDQTMAGLRNMSRRKEKQGARLITSTVITARNMKRINETLKALAAYNVDTMVLNVVEPSGEALRHFDRVTPPYADMAQCINNAVAGFPGKSKITVEGIPLCFCAGFLENCGVREEILLKEGTAFKALPTDRNHVKIDACKSCRLTRLCPGIFRKYAKRRGTAEIENAAREAFETPGVR
ncbi:MAG: radical SAM protein [Pseudomonadota bacterium]